MSSNFERGPILPGPNPAMNVGYRDFAPAEGQKPSGSEHKREAMKLPSADQVLNEAAIRRRGVDFGWSAPEDPVPPDFVPGKPTEAAAPSPKPSPLDLLEIEANAIEKDGTLDARTKGQRLRRLRDRIGLLKAPAPKPG